ncbi:hypothetical protein GQ457_09G021650 [Hibiscus cannabinus]
MGDASSFDKDGEPEQLILDDSTNTSVSSWIRNDVDANGLDVTSDMENENFKNNEKHLRNIKNNLKHNNQDNLKKFEEQVENNPMKNNHNLHQLKFQFQLLDSEEGIDEATLKHVKKWVLTYMNTKWRQWKNELKSQIFDENLTVEQIVENCKDPRVNLDQLKTLVDYWLSSKAMIKFYYFIIYITLIATNRLNMSKLEEPHCIGIRSFPRFVQDLTNESNGIPPTRADVYVKSHTCKDASILNSKAAVFVEHIQEKINKSSSSKNLSNTSWSNDMFAQVKGLEMRGCVLCVGAIHSRCFEESEPSQPLQIAEDVEGLKSKVAKLEKLFETCFLPYFQQQHPDLYVPDMDALLRMVDTEVIPDACSASAAINCISQSLPSTNQQNPYGNDPDTQ